MLPLGVGYFATASISRKAAFLPQACAAWEFPHPHLQVKARITMILSHVNEQPLSVMEKAGFDKEIGRET